MKCGNCESTIRKVSNPKHYCDCGLVFCSEQCEDDVSIEYWDGKLTCCVCRPEEVAIYTLYLHALEILGKTEKEFECDYRKAKRFKENLKWA